MNKRVWIGLAEVEQRPGTGTLRDRNCAFTNVLALADSVNDFERAAREVLDSLGFELVSIEDTEPLEDRLSTAQVAAELLSLAAEVQQTGEGRIGTLHTWISED